MTHLESLTAEYLSYLGFLLRTNIWVGKLSGGGWEGELDIVGFHPKDERVVHYETSLDAWSWARREEKYAKKFETGRKYIFEEVFPTLKESGLAVESVAVLPGRPRDGRTTIGGGRILSVDERTRYPTLRVSTSGVRRGDFRELSAPPDDPDDGGRLQEAFDLMARVPE